MTDNINHPAHYTSSPARCSCGAQIECIHVTEHMVFNLGNAVKYIWRSGLKGAALDDLRKAAWYVNREIERLTEDAELNRIADSRADGPFVHVTLDSLTGG